MGLLDNFKIKTKYGALAAVATPIVIVGGLYVAWSYTRYSRFSRSLCMGALHGSELALERLVHHHKAHTEDALSNLKKQLSDHQPDFRKLQVTISFIEVQGKEKEAANILQDKRNDLKTENKQHEVHEIEMLLVELYIYQGLYEKALQCLNASQNSETDARYPLFAAIIGILSGKNVDNKSPEEYWNMFIEIRKFHPSESDREVDELEGCKVFLPIYNIIYIFVEGIEDVAALVASWIEDGEVEVFVELTDKCVSKFIQPDIVVDDGGVGGIKDNDNSMGDDVGFNGDDENGDNLDEDDLYNVSLCSHSDEDDERNELIQNAKSFVESRANIEPVLESIRWKASDQTAGGESDDNYSIETNYLEDPNCNWRMDDDEDVVSRENIDGSNNGDGSNNSDGGDGSNNGDQTVGDDGSNNSDRGDVDGSGSEEMHVEHIRRKPRVLHLLVPPQIRKKIGKLRVKGFQRMHPSSGTDRVSKFINGALCKLQR
ncbi:hypothetical protein ACFE04_012130 [Oxalis oulophora]